MDIQVDLATKRAEAERRLEVLRQKQGAAVLDGRSAKAIATAIGEIEAELRGYDAADEEASRRITIEAKTSIRAEYLAALDSYGKARTGRLVALAKAQIAFRAYGAAIKDTVACIAQEAAAARVMHPTGHEGQLDPVNVMARLSRYEASELLAAVGRWFGGRDLASGLQGLEPGSDWVAEEAKLGDSSTFFERQTPTE